jgi:2-polyprenyl-6-methoxyphenol hydroxylase-like FAD-dependent oxidoreductase
VLISGAEIAGNALAVWLSKLAHEVTIVERFPNLRTSGRQLTLVRSTGLCNRGFKKGMGLESAFRSNAAPEQGMQMGRQLRETASLLPCKQIRKWVTKLYQ